MRTIREKSSSCPVRSSAMSAFLYRRDLGSHLDRLVLGEQDRGQGAAGGRLDLDDRFRGLHLDDALVLFDAVDVILEPIHAAGFTNANSAVREKPPDMTIIYITFSLSVPIG